MNESEIEIDLGNVTLPCTSGEIAATFAALLQEMRLVLPKLRWDERETLRRIMASESEGLTVGELFPDFRRENEDHKTLRRLRAAQFVRPVRTGRWEPGESIEVKPFARLIWNRLGEEELFPTSVLEEPQPAEPEDTVMLGKADLEPGGEDVLDILDFAAAEMQQSRS